MIARQFADAVVADLVEPGIANVADGHSAVRDDRERDDAGHAAQTIVLLGALEDLVVGNGDCFADPIGSRADGAGETLHDDVLRRCGRHLSTRLATDTIDDAKDAARRVDDRQILVIGANPTRIRTGGAAEQLRSRTGGLTHDRALAPGRSAPPQTR